MCTGNLRSGSESLFNFFKSKDSTELRKALSYFGIIGIFIIGAGFGAVITRVIGLKAVFLCIVGQACALAVLKVNGNDNYSDE